MRDAFASSVVCALSPTQEPGDEDAISTGKTMDLTTISRIFDRFRNTGADILRPAREKLGDSFRSSGLGNFSTYSEVSQQEFSSGLKVLLGEELHKYLTTEQVKAILQQVNHGLKKVNEETTVACWKYWLREDVKPVAALVIIDVQNDFISGSLALKSCPAGQDAEEVVPVINDLLSKNLFTDIGYTKDWHPSDHISFIDNVKLHPIDVSSPVDAQHAKVFDTVMFDYKPVVEQKLWPRHCEMNSAGAELHKDLKSPRQTDIVITKGSHRNVDSYSGFWDNNDQFYTKLFTELVERGVTHVFVCGLALDICVHATAVDAHHHGFRTFVIEDASRAVSKEGIAHTRAEFKKLGISLIRASEVEDKLKALHV